MEAFNARISSGRSSKCIPRLVLWDALERAVSCSMLQLFSSLILVSLSLAEWYSFADEKWVTVASEKS